MAPSRGSGCVQLLWCLRGNGSNVLDSAESSPTGTHKANGAAEEDCPKWGIQASSTDSPQERGSDDGLKWAAMSDKDLINQRIAKQHGGGGASNRVQPIGGPPNQLARRSNGDSSSAMRLVEGGGVGAGRTGGASLHDNGVSMRSLPTDVISAIDSFADSTVQAGQHSVLSGEELQTAGFKLYNPSNVTTQLPGSTVQPIAFMVLDVTRMPVGAPRPSGLFDAQGGTGAARSSGSARHRLVPVFTNSSCRTYFKISEHGDYVAVMKKLLKRDPLLSFALQKAVRHLKAGEQKSVNHVTPDPSGHTSSLCGLRLTPCVWRHERRVLPALMVEHNLPYDPDIIMPRLMRDYAVLSHVPAILTMMDFQGRVLYQNASSLEYFGDMLSIKYDAEQSGLLQVLYMYDMLSLEDMLDHVLMGQEWQGVVQVPLSLWKHLGHQEDADTIIDFIRVLGDHAHGRQESTPGASGTLNDEDEFQIGDNLSRIKKQHQRPPTFLLKHQANGAGNGTPSKPGAEPSATEPRRSPDDVSGLRQSSTGSLHEAPAGVPGTMQQRKFMSLLEHKQGAGTGAGAGGAPAGSRRPSDIPEDPPTTAEESEGSADEDSEPECYHEVHAIPLLDPVLDKQVIMLVQTDVTPRVELENKLADLTDAQLSMLEQLFPRHIIEYMLARVPSKVTRNLRELANTHDKVMVLFCDVVGFTSMSKEVEAAQVMHFLNELYQAFDNLVDDYGMYKLDIVGDCYIVVAGLIKEDQDGFVCVDELDDDQVAVNAVRIMQFAKAMLRESQPVLMPHNSQPVSLRIGIHTGPLVSGLVGSKMPKFTLFGDTMNTASRMESTCRPGAIHVSDAFSQLLPHEQWESTGGVQVKGKGLMLTFLWNPETQRKDVLPEQAPDSAVRTLKKVATFQSFTSNKSRHSTHSASTARKRDSESGVERESRDPLSLSNPLMTILQNIRVNGEDDSTSEAAGGGGGGGGAASRPKSGRFRMPTRRRSYANFRSMEAGQADGASAGTSARRQIRISENNSMRASPTAALEVKLEHMSVAALEELVAGGAGGEHGPGLYLGAGKGWGRGSAGGATGSVGWRSNVSSNKKSSNGRMPDDEQDDLDDSVLKLTPAPAPHLAVR